MATMTSGTSVRDRVREADRRDAARVAEAALAAALVRCEEAADRVDAAPDAYTFRRATVAALAAQDAADVAWLRVALLPVAGVR